MTRSTDIAEIVPGPRLTAGGRRLAMPDVPLIRAIRPYATHPGRPTIVNEAT